MRREKVKETLKYSQETDVGVWRTQLAALLILWVRNKMKWTESHQNAF